MFVTSRIAKDALGVVALLAAAALVGWHCYTHTVLPDAPQDSAHTAGADFRDVMYYPTRASLAGVNPYDSSTDKPGSYASRFPAGNNFPLYSPLIFVPALPLAILPLEISVAIWWLLTVGLTVVLAYVAWRWAGVVPTIAMTTGLAAAILLSRPGYANIYFGQATLLFLLASLAALHWARRKPYLAGLALAIATMKPTFGGPLAILMFCRRDWKAASVGSLVGFAAAVLGLAIIFARDNSGQSLAAVIHTNQATTDRDPAVDPAQSNSRIDAPLVVERLLGRAGGPLARLATTILILAMTGFILWRATSHRAGPATPAGDDFDRLSSGLILVTMAGCIYHNIYDGLLLVIPAAMASPWPGRRGTVSSRWMGVILCSLLIVPAISYFSSLQFGQLLAKMFPAVVAEAWTPGHTPLMIQLANGCAVFAAWLLLLIATWRAVTIQAPGVGITQEGLNAKYQANEALALATTASPNQSRGPANQSLTSQQAAPFPVLHADPQGVCQ